MRGWRSEPITQASSDRTPSSSSFTSASVGQSILATSWFEELERLVLANNQEMLAARWLFSRPTPLND